MIDSKLKKDRKKTGGRKKGTPNKTTTVLKDAIMNTFDKAGGEKYLLMVAKDDPKTFCTLLAKVLPTELKGEILIPTVFKNFLGQNGS